jgi:hypothetical protein
LDIGRPKAAAALRTTDLLPALHDMLAEHKATHRGGLDDLLFPTARGGRRDKDNINKRVLKPVPSAPKRCRPTAAGTRSRAG